MHSPTQGVISQGQPVFTHPMHCFPRSHFATRNTPLLKTNPGGIRPDSRKGRRATGVHPMELCVEKVRAAWPTRLKKPQGWNSMAEKVNAHMTADQKHHRHQRTSWAYVPAGPGHFFFRRPQRWGGGPQHWTTHPKGGGPMPDAGPPSGPWGSLDQHKITHKTITVWMSQRLQCSTCDKKGKHRSTQSTSFGTSMSHPVIRQLSWWLTKTQLWWSTSLGWQNSKQGGTHSPTVDRGPQP